MYRTIDAAFWTDPKIRGLSSGAKLMFLYLITNTHTHLSGLYYLPTVVIAHEIGVGPETGKVDAMLDTLSGAGLVRLDKKLELVWVVNMLHYQGCGEKSLRAAANQLRTLHNSPLVKEFVAKYPSVKRFYKHREKHGVSIPYPAQDQVGTQEQEQEQKQEQNKNPSRLTPRASGKTRTRDELFDAVAEVTASDPNASGAFIGRICKDLRTADPPYTPDEVRRAAAIIRTDFRLDGHPGLPLLLQNIGRVRAPALPPPPPRGNHAGQQRPDMRVREHRPVEG